MNYFNEYEDERFYRIALDNNTSTEILSEISKKTYSDKVLRAVVGHMKTTSDIITTILNRANCEDLDDYFFIVVARNNREFSNDDFDLIYEKGCSCQIELAQNRILSLKQQELVSNSPYWRARERLAGWTNNQVVIDKFTNDSNVHVRCTLAVNSNIKSHNFETLSKDSSPDVKDCLTRNEFITKPILEHLANDSNVHVRISAASRLRRHDYFK